MLGKIDIAIALFALACLILYSLFYEPSWRVEVVVERVDLDHIETSTRR
jgi:LPS O-antigen subunit length determinant protein (WzzB/FepE family)